MAALLRKGRSGPEVLLMERAQRAEDKWSGQICLPGGGFEPADADLEATARRETCEELGFDLGACSAWLGTLDTRQAGARGKLLDLQVTPFVYAQEQEPVLDLGPEATDAFWFPLAAAARGELDSEIPIAVGKQRHRYPAWHFGRHFVWGLTRGILGDLLKRLGNP